MAERWIVTIDGASTVLPVTNQQGAVRVLEQATPAPEPDESFAERREGALTTSRGWKNRTVTLKLEVERPTDQWWNVSHNFGAGAPLEAEGDGTVPGFTGTTRRVDGAGSPLIPAIEDLSQIVGEMQTAPDAVAGTLTRVMESGDRITFDVVAAAMADGPNWDHAVYLRDATQVTLQFTCLPFARGQEVLLGSGSSTAGQRFVVIDDLEVPGDVDALARIVYSGAVDNQRTVLYGVDRPDAATSATGVQLDASTLDLPAPSVVTTLAGSVASQVVSRSVVNFDAGWVPVVRLSRSGVPLAVSGTYRVWARARTGSSPIRMRWTSGAREAGMTTNAAIPVRGAEWRLHDLGLITVNGQLDGVVECQTPTALASVVDVLLLQPTERSGVLQARPTLAEPGETTVQDPAIGTGVLAGSPAAFGGNWLADVGGGAAWVRTSQGISRTQSAGSWRSASIAIDPGPKMVLGVGLTYMDYDPDPDSKKLLVMIGNAAGIASLGSGSTAAPGAWAVGVAVLDAGWGSNQRLWAVRGGEVPVGFQPLAATSSSILEVDAELGYVFGAGGLLPLPGPIPATGMLLAIGSTGLTVSGAAAPVTVGAIGLYVNSVLGDVALAAGKSTVIATGGALRTTPSGVTSPVLPVGDRPVLPSSGRAGRPVRVAAGVVYGRLVNQVDGLPSAPLSVQVYGTPRWLQVPS